MLCSSQVGWYEENLVSNRRPAVAFLNKKQIFHSAKKTRKKNPI